MRKNVFTLILTLFITTLTYSQQISQIDVKQVGQTIEIYYQLDKQADISVLISINGGSFKELKKVTGDVGINISPGRKNKIVWHVLEEYDKFVEENVKFRVMASESSAAKAQRAAEAKKVAESKKVAETKRIRSQNAQKCIQKNFVGFDFGIGNYFDAGLRYTHHFIPYFGMEVKVAALGDMSFDDVLFQAMAGIRANTPTIHKCLSIYSAFRCGIGYYIYDGDTEYNDYTYSDGKRIFGDNTFHMETELGINIVPEFSMGLCYLYTGSSYTTIALKITLNFSAIFN